MQSLNQYLAVFIGAGIGGTMRHGANQVAARWLAAGIPWSTFAVNVLGSIAVGAVTGYFAASGEGSATTKLFVATGILGGFTTFSAFSLEVTQYLQRGQLATAALYVAGSLLFSVAGVFAGLAAAR
jgi:CrcB protein